MAILNTNVAPYYDSTNLEVGKNYYKLLAVPGRVAQAREITVLQGLLQNAIKSLGDSIMSNGDIIEGCQVIVAEDKKSVTITPGKIYVEGMVSTLGNVDPATGELIAITVPISGVGSEIIGVKINETIITDTIDVSLKDPAQGYDNYGQTGCDRLKRELQVVINDSDSSPIATLSDGELYLETYAPTYDTLTQTLARRTYDESGSYIVNGLNVRVEGKDSENYYVVVEAGKAYVLGYELKIPTARRITVPRATTFSNVVANNYVYRTGTNSYILDSDPYVKSINFVRGRTSTIEQQVIQTNTDAVVLDNNDVVSLIEVKQGDVSYTIGSSPTEGDCYLLRDGTRYYVKWNGNNAPTTGGSYNVTYEYNKDFISEVDYTLSVDGNGSYVIFTESGSKPIDNTNFSVDYNQYLARRDVVYVDQYGGIKVEQGSPDEDGYEVTPSAPVNTLPIANIFNPPNGSATATLNSLMVSVSNIGLTRFTMNDIQNIVNRVKKTEYNQAVLSLNDDARNRTSITSKKGILTDPLVDFSRIDFYYNLNNEGNKIDPDKSVYDMAIDLDAGYGYLPVNVYSYNISGQSNSTKKYKRLVTLSTSGENIVLSQMNATKSFQVNPYSVFPQLPEVMVDPSVDSWVEDTYVQVPVSLTNSAIISTNTSILYNTVRRSWGGSYNYSTSSTSSRVTDTAVGSTTETSITESVISEEAVTYMRTIDITIEGFNYPPNVDNLKCSFDGIQVPLTPVDGTLAGTLDGTVKANDEGYIKAKFTIPNNIRTGIREVKLWTDTEVLGYTNTGYTLFQSSGINRTIQQTITTVTTVLLQREVTNTVTTTNWIDPVGQSFVLDKMSVLKGIDIFFEAKPATNEEIVLEVRNISNGSIGSTVYTTSSLRASQVVVSPDASKATRFNFNDPIVLDKDTEYAFVIRSLSDKYRVWVSEIGGTDVETGEMVLKNSYMTGVMFSSSNNSTWTAHQTMDIKFKIYEDVYDRSGSITFDPIVTDGITRLDLSAESVVLNGTSLKWYYSTNGGTTFYSITPGVLRELGYSTNEVIFKADFSRDENNNLTPILAYDSLLLVGSSYKNSGSYVGVNVTGIDEYDTVTVIMDTLIPSGTSLSVYASSDNGDTLIECVRDTAQTKQLNNGWQESVYTGSIAKGTSCRVFINAASSSSSYTPKFSAVKIIMN